MLAAGVVGNPVVVLVVVVVVSGAGAFDFCRL